MGLAMLIHLLCTLTTTMSAPFQMHNNNLLFVFLLFDASSEWEKILHSLVYIDRGMRNITTSGHFTYIRYFDISRNWKPLRIRIWKLRQKRPNCYVSAAHTETSWIPSFFFAIIIHPLGMQPHNNEYITYIHSASL